MKRNPWDEVLDSIIVSDEWDNLDYEMKEEQAGLMDPETFAECEFENNAHTYLNHAERILKLHGPLSHGMEKLIDDLRKDAGQYESYHVFIRALRLFIAVVQAGTVPGLANMGADYGETQSIKGKKPRTRNGLTPTERKQRDKKIKKHFAKSRLTKVNSFAKKYSQKYNLSIRQITNILKS
jgi:hypothetical protein